MSGPIDQIKQSYGSNVFGITLKGDIDKVKGSLNSNYELISHTEDMGIVKAQVKVHNFSTDNELLKQLLPVAEILGFNPVVPNMNDIFINVVQEYNKAQGKK